MSMKMSFKTAALAAAITINLPSLAYSAVLEEVVVTAQKREQSLQDVPISVDVVQADDLKNRAINNAQDLAIATPSVQFQKGGMPFANNFVIRGIGSMSFEGGIQPSVSFVVDGVPLARISEFSADLGDIERIEILRGPQGTLYGRNATGGAVNIVRAAPTDETEAYVQQTITDDEEYTTRLMYNTALSDAVNMRLSGSYTNRDDYIENVIDGNPDLGGEETYGVMAKFGININDTTDLLITTDYRDQKSSEGSQHVDVVESGNPTYDFIGAARTAALGAGSFGDAAAFTLGQTVINDPFKTSQDTEQQADMKAYGISFDLTSELNDEITLKSITAYRSSESHSVIDIENSPANGVNPYSSPIVALIGTSIDVNPGETVANEIEYFSQEFRLEGSTDKAEWIGGIYYSHTNEVVDNTVPTYVPAYDLVRIDPKQGEATWDAYAIFGDVTFSLSDSFSVFAGLRWTQEEMDIDFSSSVYSIFGASSLAPAVVLGESFTEVDLGALSVTPVTVAFTRKDTSADWSGRLGFNWDVSDEARLYASASRGFVGAGANVGRAANYSNSVVDPSSTQAYELGIKSRLLESSLQLNAALFWQEVTDLQTSRVIPNSIQTETFNAGTLTTQGLELTADWAATEMLTLGANISYVDSEIDNLTQPCFPGQASAEGCNVPNGTAFIQDVSGHEMIFAPELAYSLRARVDLPLDDMPFDLFAQLTYTWQDDMYTTLEYDPLLTQQDYGLTDVAIGMDSKDGDWQVLLFGKNITDEYFSSGKTASVGQQGRVLSRTTRGAQAYWGLTAKYNF